MKKGAVPVPYIIALLLGIAVVAIIGYWFFMTSGELGEEATLSKCRAHANNYCNSWKILDWSTIDEYDDDDNLISSTPTVGWFLDRYLQCEQQEGVLGFSGGTSVTTDEGACLVLVGQ